MSDQNNQNNTTTPSPTPSPSPSPLPRVRPVDKSTPSTLKKVEKQPSPTPPSVDIKALAKGLSRFEWAELNRALEILRFFDDALIPFIKRSNINANVIAMLRIALATRLSVIILRKYQTISTSFNLESAIDIIDEQLPKLIKSSGSTINAEDILKLWNTLKDIIRGNKK
jgi:hypothetical protein